MNRTTNGPDKRSIVVFVCLVLWLLVTGAALSAMYKLWWERERQEYYGRSPTEQRVVVWQKAGLSEQLLRSVEQARRTWPTTIGYGLIGDRVKLSYAEYLLLPRLPVGGSGYLLYDSGEVAPDNEVEHALSADDENSTPRGIIFSLIALLGVALSLKRWRPLSFLSFPEAFGCAILAVVAAGLLTKSATGSVSLGFLCFTGLSVAAWSILLVSWMRGDGKRVSWTEVFRFRSISILGWFSIVVIGASVLWALAMAVVVVPDDWDAWAIWGAKAKTLALVTGPLADVTYFGHPDYPLLWPSLWAYSGWLGGGWEEQWSRGWGAVLLLLSCWETAVIIWRRTGHLSASLLGAAFFASVPMVPLIASWSYAEAPFWFFIITSFGLLDRYVDERSLRILVSAALMAVGAAYTKNEGVLFAFLAVSWLLAVCRQRRLASAALFFMVWAICYAPWAWWVKVAMGFGSHATAGLHLDMETIARVVTRIPTALQAIGSMWLDIRQWNLVLGAALVACLPVLFDRTVRSVLVIPFGMLCGYFTIVVFHQAEIYWQVGTAWNRLTLHALPFLILVLSLWLHRHLKERRAVSP